MRGDTNIALIEAVASALKPLLSRLVFLGGSTVGLLITDDTRPAVRATVDVDLVVELAGKVEYYELCETLRQLGLREDPDVVCRWRYGGIKIDVMPTDAAILGFSNRWYPKAVSDAVTLRLPSGTEIQVVSAPLLLATKLEAFHHRGEGDYGGSHDIEDIINLVDGRPELVAEVEAVDEALRDYLQTEAEAMLTDTNFTPYIAWHLHPEDYYQDREEIVIDRLRAIAGI